MASSPPLNSGFNIQQRCKYSSIAGRCGKCGRRGLDTAVYFHGKSISLFLTSYPQRELGRGISFAATIQVAAGPSAHEGLGQR